MALFVCLLGLAWFGGLLDFLFWIASFCLGSAWICRLVCLAGLLSHVFWIPLALLVVFFAGLRICSFAFALLLFMLFVKEGITLAVLLKRVMRAIHSCCSFKKSDSHKNQRANSQPCFVGGLDWICLMGCLAMFLHCQIFFGFV